MTQLVHKLLSNPWTQASRINDLGIMSPKAPFLQDLVLLCTLGLKKD